MNNEELKSKIQSLASDTEFVESGQYLTANVPYRKINAICKNLKEGADTAFDYLFNLTGMDYLEQNQMAVIYHLESTTFHHIVVLKAIIPTRENPEIETVSNVWVGANFHEREVFDFFGITFKNHPDMRRIFLDEISDSIGHPFRKDYVDEVNIIER
ncbi:MAG: NADH-quinone oxidoreductase subunit C [Bacteroidota bacterium]